MQLSGKYEYGEHKQCCDNSITHSSNSGGMEVKAEEHPDSVRDYSLLKDKSQNRTSGFTLATPRGQNG